MEYSVTLADLKKWAKEQNWLLMREEKHDSNGRFQSSFMTPDGEQMTFYGKNEIIEEWE